MQGTSKNGLYYEIEGEGPWLTLSHSLACDLHMWDPQMELLTKHFKVLRFDTRGHGKSNVPSAPYTLEALGQDVVELFLELGIQRTHWMGLSMGGMIGQTMALKWPQLFLSLVLADTTSRRPENAVQMWADRTKVAREQGMQGLLEITLKRWFTQPYIDANSAKLQKIAKGILETPVEGFAGCSSAIAHIDTFDRLKEINCPTMIIVGIEDHGTPPEMAKKIHSQIKDSVLHIIPDASHISNVEQTEIFNQHLVEFFGLEDDDFVDDGSFDS
jgi:3-oxoadipate enol-lactonase